ncbi:MAG: DUF4158 domain-containing protein [Actinobacteria bacterium]|nr:DUF4158 domain-containing protein [Actinomycetota bacterium]
MTRFSGRGVSRGLEEHLLALVLSLKCFQRLGYFPRRMDVPDVVADHLRGSLELAGDVEPEVGAERTVTAQHQLVRERVGVVLDPERARALARDAIREAAWVKNNPPDLINVALEILVKASLELPGFSTLNAMAAQIRAEVNTALFEQIVARMAWGDRVRLEQLLDAVGASGKSDFNRLKQPAGRATWSSFREQVAHLRWVDSLGNTGAWLEGVAESKIADFAGEAFAADAAVMGDVAPLKRTALLACAAHVARTRARDDLAEMFCKRMAQVTKRAREQLEEIHKNQAEMSERLIGHYRDVLAQLDPRNPAAMQASTALELARRTVEVAGGFDQELADIEAVAAHHANNYMPLVAGHRRRDRATMFAFVRIVELEATSADRSVLDALAHALAHAELRRDYIPDHVKGALVDLSFASEQWQRLVRDRGHPGRLARRHFEACVFTYLAEELRTGDIAVCGSQAYANWSAQLLPWTECKPLLDEFCAEAGLPSTAREFTDGLRTKLTRQAELVDAGSPRTPT